MPNPVQRKPLKGSQVTAVAAALWPQIGLILVRGAALHCSAAFCPLRALALGGLFLVKGVKLHAF